MTRQRKISTSVPGSVENTTPSQDRASEVNVRQIEDASIKAQAELRESEERFRQMADNIEEVFWMLDAKTSQVIYVNPAFETISGRTRQSLYEAPLSYRELFHQEDKDRVLMRLSQLPATGKFDEEFRIIRPDGEMRWVWARGFTVKDTTGAVTRLVGVAQDITIRREAQEALRLREDLYRDLVEHSEDLICTHDLRGYLLSVNEVPVRILGYTPQELLNRPMREFVVPEYRDKFEQYLISIQKEGHADGLLAVVTKEGKKRIWEYHNTLRTEGVPFPIVRGIAHDVTDRLRTERELRESQEKFSKAFHSSPCSISITTLETDIFLDVNESFERTSGYSREELIGRSAYELRMLLEADFPIAEAARKKIREEGRIEKCELRFRHRSGSIMEATWSAEVIEIGGKRCLLTIGEDITQRKRAEEALRRSEAAYRLLFEEAPYGIFRCDLDGTLRVANPALAKMLGYKSPEELVGINLAKDLIVGTFTNDLWWKDAQEEESGPAVEKLWKHKAQKTVLTRIRSRKAWGQQNGLPCVEGFVEEITEQRLLEQRLQQSQKMEAIAVLAGGIAHDFNTLLIGILGYGERLLMASGLSDALRGEAEEIVQAALQARTLTQQLLALGRKQALQPKIVHLNGLINDLGELLRGLLGERITLVTKLDPNTMRVKIDPSQFMQVLMNLAINARDAMPNGGTLTIATSGMHVATTRGVSLGMPSGNYVALTVTDTGHGMDQRTQERIFEPFFTTKPQGKGTGLGLSTVHGIIEQSGGQIHVSSELDKGTAFTIYLPGTWEISEQDAKEPLRHGSLSGLETILVVDDNDVSRKLTCDILTEHGYTILKAHDGHQALQIGNSHPAPIHLLLTDVVMAGMSGQKLVQRLTPMRPEMSILYMTGYTDALLPGMNGVDRIANNVLQKPFLAHELTAKVREILLQGRKGRAHSVH